MTQADKQLLLVDLCARLPYGIICQMEDAFIINDSPFYNYILSERHIDLFRNHKDFFIKPYLRPLSSMTEEEKVKYCYLQDKFLLSSQYPVTDGYALFDWLDKKMFDYRELIPKGLANKALEGMYNI